MTGRRRDVPDTAGVQYVPALDPDRYIGRRRPTRSVRHKIDDNLTGVPGFCPLVRRTDRLAEDRIAGLAAEARATMAGADPATLHRAVSFRSEEHTSELQSLMRISYAVFSLKKTKTGVNKKNNRT